MSPSMSLPLISRAQTLMGEISTAFGDLKGLFSIDLRGNLLSGQIPDDIGDCVALKSFMFRRNIVIIFKYVQEDCFYDLPYNTGYQIFVLCLRKTSDEIMKCTLSMYVDI